MTFITDFADQAVMLPIAFAVAAALALLGWPRGAVAWLIAAGGTFATILVLKLAMAACFWMLPDGAPRSPSGHTAAAAVVYGGLLAILGARARWSKLTILASVALLAFAVGLTRIFLGVHSWPDIAAGTLIGAGGALTLIRLAGPVPPRLNLGAIAGVVIAVVLAFHGTHLHAEEMIRDIAQTYPWPLSACR